MIRPLMLILLLVLLPAWAQEPDDANPDAAEAKPEETTDAADEAQDVTLDEFDFSDEQYSDEEDEFIPSENVKFGQSIPFPTDI